VLQVFVIEVLDPDELVLGVARQNNLVELGLDSASIPRLRILQHEHHQERNNGRSGIDDQLPSL